MFSILLRQEEEERGDETFFSPSLPWVRFQSRKRELEKAFSVSCPETEEA